MGIRSQAFLGGNRKMSPEDDGNLFNGLWYVHGRLGHPCGRVWGVMMKDTGLWTGDIMRCVEGIYEECDACKQFVVGIYGGVWSDGSGRFKEGKDWRIHFLWYGWVFKNDGH